MLIVNLAVNFSNTSPATGLPIRRVVIAFLSDSGKFSGDNKSIALPIVKRGPTAKPGSKSPSSASLIPFTIVFLSIPDSPPATIFSRSGVITFSNNTVLRAAFA